MKVSLSNSSSFDFGRVDDSALGNWQSQLITIPIASYSPSFFHYSDGAQSVALAFDKNGNLIGSANPVARSDYFTTYANGLGLLNSGPVSGDPAPGPPAPLATTAVTPTISIGGQSAQVLFSGLTPGFVGLYQLNVVVPAGISAGLQPMALSIGGVTASTQIQVK
jgi:minor extracellular serine protease Vpr